MAVLLSSRTCLAPVTLATRADEAGGPPSKFYEISDNLWRGRRIVSVRGALRWFGWLMRRRDCTYLEAHDGYLMQCSNHDYYWHAAHTLSPNRLRLHHWVEEQVGLEHRQELIDLEQSIYERSSDLLRARDAVAFECLRLQQDNATLDALLYHVRAAVPFASALFDSVAVFAQLALQIPVSRAEISFAKPRFRRALTHGGGPQLAAVAAGFEPVWTMLSALRDPLVHRAGLAGIGYQRDIGPSENRLVLRDEQAEAVDAAAQWNGASADAWGLDRTIELYSTVAPLQFLDRFAVTSVVRADELVQAFAGDLQAPPSERVRQPGEVEKLWKYGLLSGLGNELEAADRADEVPIA